MNTVETPDPKRRRPWRLRTRLALAILVVFMPITALVMVSHIENLGDRRDSRLKSLQTVGQTVAASVDGFARDLESFSIATAAAFGSADVGLNQAEIGPYLALVQQSYGSVLRSVFIIDTNGTVVASGATPSGISADLSTRPYVKVLQGGKESVWSGAIAGSETGRTTLVHGRVVRSSTGAVRGYLLIAFYPEVLAAERFPSDVPQDGDVSLIDDMGNVLFSSKAPDTGQPQPRNIASDPVYRKAHDGTPVLLRSGHSALASEKSYGAFIPVPKTSWVVGFTRPASAIDGPLQERFFRDLLIVSASIIAGFSAMLIAASRLSRPLSRLAFAAGAIARGERPVLPTAAADAEVQELEIAMDTMSRAVTERQERLAQQARVLETLERIGEMMAELDFSKVAGSITQASLELTEADAAGIFYRPLFDEGHIELASFAGEVPEFPLAHDDEIVQQTVAGEVVDMPDLAGGPRLLLDKDGTRVAQSLLGVPMRGRGGVIVGGLFLLREQKEAFGDYERRLALGMARRAGMALENARTYSQARETQEQLAEANKAKTEFIGLLSHELRTPLTTIYGGARLLHTRRDTLPEQDAIELIESIEEESERLRRLVENLLALARADIGEEVARDIISVGPVIDQTVKQFSNRRPGRPVELHVDRGLPLVLAEPTYIRQVLHNLITNADKYSPSGLPIDVEAGNGADETIEVRVLDRGPGVSPDEIGQIFGSFYRSERTARTAGGKGLGLTVCRRLVEAMGGQVWARPRDGGGLVVGFTLPMAQEPEAIAAQAEG